MAPFGFFGKRFVGFGTQRLVLCVASVIICPKTTDYLFFSGTNDENQGKRGALYLTKKSLCDIITMNNNTTDRSYMRSLNNLFVKASAICGVD